MIQVSRQVAFTFSVAFCGFGRGTGDMTADVLMGTHGGSSPGTRPAGSSVTSSFITAKGAARPECPTITEGTVTSCNLCLMCRTAAPSQSSTAINFNKYSQYHPLNSTEFNFGYVSISLNSITIAEVLHSFLTSRTVIKGHPQECRYSRSTNTDNNRTDHCSSPLN